MRDGSFQFTDEEYREDLMRWAVKFAVGVLLVIAGIIFLIKKYV